MPKSILISGTSGHITTTTGGNGVYYSSGVSGTFGPSIVKLHILGEDYELKNSYNDSTLAITIATLNVLKRPFWDELKKQSIKFDKDLEEFIEERLRILDRDVKLETLLPNQS